MELIKASTSQDKANTVLRATQVLIRAAARMVVDQEVTMDLNMKDHLLRVVNIK